MLGALPQLKTLLPIAVLFAVALLRPQAGIAAGCHYAESNPQVLTSGEPGVFAEDIWWAVGPVRCVYEYGQFKYYQIPTVLMPCNGPGCRGKIPTDVVGQPVIIEVERQTLNVSLAGGPLLQIPPPSFATCAAELAPSCPFLLGLLRPPNLA